MWRRSIIAWLSEDRPLMAAVNVDIGADDKLGAPRREERDRIGDVVRLTPAAERHLRAPVRFLLLEAATEIDLVVEREAVCERCLDAARAYRIDENAVRRELVRQRFHEGMLCGIDDVRGNRVCLRYLAGLADDDDETAAAALLHGRDGGAGQLPGAGYLCGEMKQQRVAVDVIKPARHVRPRIADDNIQPPERGGDLVN